MHTRPAEASMIYAWRSIWHVCGFLTERQSSLAAEDGQKVEVFNQDAARPNLKIKPRNSQLETVRNEAKRLNERSLVFNKRCSSCPILIKDRAEVLKALSGEGVKP